MTRDESTGLLPFLIEKRGLTKLGVAADLFESRDSIHFAGMFVVDLIVTHPEFKWKIGTQGNQSMELHGVPDGPGETHGQENGENKRETPWVEETSAKVAVRDPPKQEGEKCPEGRIG